MANKDHLEQEIEKKFARKDKRKTKKMKVSGKNVFTLQKTLAKKSPKKD